MEISREKLEIERAKTIERIGHLAYVRSMLERAYSQQVSHLIETNIELGQFPGPEGE